MRCDGCGRALRDDDPCEWCAPPDLDEIRDQIDAQAIAKELADLSFGDTATDLDEWIEAVEAQAAELDTDDELDRSDQGAAGLGVARAAINAARARRGLAPTSKAERARRRETQSAARSSASTIAMRPRTDKRPKSGKQ